jgi:DNA-binding NarL/FixJ family response regulator
MLISLTRPIRVLIADDHPVVRDGLAAILTAQSDLTVVAQVGNGQEAIEQFRLHQPDVAIVDLRMPEIGGVEAIQTICQEFPDACFIMLTIYDGDEDIFRGFRAGAKAYLLKDTPCEEIIEVIRAVCEGQRYLPTGISERLADRMTFPELSDREQQVLRLMADGKSNKEIGTAIGISESTARFHVSNIMDKLGVSDRTLAVVTALKRGIIQL